jgi:hypothetical protein
VIARTLALAGVLLLLGAGAADAQVFVASRRNPEFSIGPLFVSARVGPALDRVTINVSWSITPPPNRSTDGLGQDLVLLWPTEAHDRAEGGRDPGLVHEIERRGFTVKSHGVLPLTVIHRLQFGSGAEPAVIGQLPFVTFFKNRPRTGPSRAATFISIPWRKEFSDRDALFGIKIEARDLITERHLTWFEHTFFGPRHIIAVSFSDVGHAALYPLYFEHRDRVVRLANDFSQVSINFDNADHLRIDEIAPATARRRPSESRPNTDLVSIPLIASEGLTPQILKVQFTYFHGQVAWRPILISLLFLIVGNITGPIAMTIVRRVGRTLRARVHVGKPSEAPARRSGTVLGPDTLARIVPGETTYDQVLALCGRDAEEQRRLGDHGERTLTYRGRHLVPQRRRTLGWLSTVSHWDEEHNEVVIEFEQDRVKDLQVRVRRTRLAGPEGA